MGRAKQKKQSITKEVNRRALTEVERLKLENNLLCLQNLELMAKEQKENLLKAQAKLAGEIIITRGYNPAEWQVNLGTWQIEPLKKSDPLKEEAKCGNPLEET